MSAYGQLNQASLEFNSGSANLVKASVSANALTFEGSSVKRMSL